MNKLLNTLLRTSITASMSDREAFTEKVSKVVEDKIGADPELAKKMSDGLAAAMDSINDQLLINQLFDPQSDNKKLEDKIDKLTSTIERLNSNIEKLIDNGIK
ncbi:MAG: hypothetical protein RRZ64_08205 [Rikenellaceae bacterium]